MPLIYPHCDAPGCTEQAQWSIQLPDSRKHFCTLHIGGQLTPGFEHRIMPAAPDLPVLITPPALAALLEKLRQRFGDREAAGRV